MRLFVSFEGPEGSGKSTQIKLLEQALHQRNASVVSTREPGGTPISEQVRAVLHDPQNRAMLPTTEILLYSASRAQHVGQVVRPALERGDIVVTDRFAESTLAYQGYGRGLDLNALNMITAFATGGLRPPPQPGEVRRRDTPPTRPLARCRGRGAGRPVARSGLRGGGRGAPRP